MGKFCTKCGRPLQEGQVCVCQMPAARQAERRQAMEDSLSPVRQQSREERQAELRRQYEARQRMAQRLAGAAQVSQHGSNTQQAAQQGYRTQQATQQGYRAQQATQQGYRTQQTSQRGYSTQQTSQRYEGTGAQQTFQAASGYAQNFFGTVIQLIQHPVTFGRKLILAPEVKTAAMLMVLQGFCTGLFALAVSHKMAGYIKAGVGLAGGLDSDIARAVTGLLDMPYVRIFVVTILYSVALALAYTCLLFIGHRIIKAPARLSQMLSTASIRSTVMAPAILLSLIMFEISAMWGLALFTYTNLVAFAAITVADCTVFGQQKADIFVLMSGIVFILFVLLVFFSWTKVFTLYLPDVIRTSLKSLGDLSGQELLEELFDYF